MTEETQTKEYTEVEGTLTIEVPIRFGRLNPDEYDRERLAEMAFNDWQAGYTHADNALYDLRERAELTKVDIHHVTERTVVDRDIETRYLE